MIIKDYCNIPVKIKVSDLFDLTQIHNWLSTNVEPGKCYLGSYDYENKTKYIYFADRNDAIYFSLVWE